MFNNVTRLFEDDVRESDVGDVQNLLKQLRGEKPVETVTLKILKNCARENHVMIVRDKQSRVVGMATLVVTHGWGGQRGEVRDVIIDELCRRRGHGREIMEKIISYADAKGLPKLKLESNDNRVEAHELYKSLGFEDEGLTRKFARVCKH